MRSSAATSPRRDAVRLAVVQTDSVQARGERLRAFLAERAAGPVVWGESDCCALAASWIVAETGRTMALPRYASALDGARLMARAGGLVPLVAPLLAQIGLQATDEPQLGDVGVIRISDRDVAAVFATHAIAVARCEVRGTFYFQPREILRAWSLDQR